MLGCFRGILDTGLCAVTAHSGVTQLSVGSANSCFVVMIVLECDLFSEGYKSQKCADSSSAAASQATEELFTLLIQMRFIDRDSLHHKPEVATRPPGT